VDGHQLPPVGMETLLAYSLLGLLHCASDSEDVYIASSVI